MNKPVFEIHASDGGLTIWQRLSPKKALPLADVYNGYDKSTRDPCRTLAKLYVEAPAMLGLLRKVAMMEHRINHQDCHCALCFAPAQASAIIARIAKEV